jgi:hypothetical protein
MTATPGRPLTGGVTGWLFQSGANKLESLTNWLIKSAEGVAK